VGFLREYGPWIAVPILVVLGGLVVLYLLGAGSTPGEFIYSVF